MQFHVGVLIIPCFEEDGSYKQPQNHLLLFFLSASKVYLQSRGELLT